MFKWLTFAFALIIFFSGCEETELVSSQDFHTPATLSKATFEPAHGGYEFGYDFMSGKFKVHWVNYPDKYEVVFSSSIGNFSFYDKETYETYKGFVGKNLDLVYREIHLVTYERQAEKGGEKKERSRVFRRDEFVRAQVK
jgi:hypothetical protein